MDRSSRKSTTDDSFTTSESGYTTGDTTPESNDLVTDGALLGEPSIAGDLDTAEFSGTSDGDDQIGIYEGRARDIDSEDASHDEPLAGFVEDASYSASTTDPIAFETATPGYLTSSTSAYAESAPALDAPAAPDIKQTVTQAGDQAKQVAGQIGDQVKQTAGQVVEQAKGQATDFVTTAKQQLNTQITAQKDNATKRLDGFTETLRQTGQTFNDKGEGAVGTLVTGLADQIDSTSGYLKNRDVDQITRETEVFARQQPGLFLGLAFVAGVAVARFLKSTQSPTY